MAGRESIFSDESHSDAVSDLREAIGDDISSKLSDMDCVRFLRARPGSIERAAEMVRSWNAWRHTLLEPLPPAGLRFSPNIILANPHVIPMHPHIGLLPVAHFGFDKGGRPIYWEKTGTIQNNFGEVFKHFTTDELVQYHIASQECFTLRFKYASERANRVISDSVVVFDMKNVNMTLNMQSIAYMREILAIDQKYYPETLYKLFIVNCPWYFTALFSLFKPLIDARTKAKFNLLGSDYLAALLEHIDISQIPEYFGGEAEDVPWDLQNPDSSGCSLAQIEQFMRTTYTEETIPRLLTPEERDALSLVLQEASAIQTGTKTVWNLPRAIAIRRDSGVHNESTEQDNPWSGLPARPHYSERLSADGLAVVTSGVDPNHQHHHAHVPLTPMKTRMVKAEDTSKYHLYLLIVDYGDSASWPIRRRYSDFDKLNLKLKDLSQAFPSVVWPKLPPKRYFFKRSKSVVAVRLVGLDFFLSAVLDRIIRIELGTRSSADDVSPSGSTPQAISLRQQLRITILEFLEVTDHVATSVDDISTRDFIIRQLNSIDYGITGAPLASLNNRRPHSLSEPTRIPRSAGLESSRSFEEEDSSQRQKPNVFSVQLIVLCIALFSGLIGYYFRLLYHKHE